MRIAVVLNLTAPCWFSTTGTPAWEVWGYVFDDGGSESGALLASFYDTTERTGFNETGEVSARKFATSRIKLETARARRAEMEAAGFDFEAARVAKLRRSPYGRAQLDAEQADK
jgi:hypothetical protein